MDLEFTNKDFSEYLLKISKEARQKLLFNIKKTQKLRESLRQIGTNVCIKLTRLTPQDIMNYTSNNTHSVKTKADKIDSDFESQHISHSTPLEQSSYSTTNTESDLQTSSSINYTDIKENNILLALELQPLLNYTTEDSLSESSTAKILYNLHEDSFSPCTGRKEEIRYKPYNRTPSSQFSSKKYEPKLDSNIKECQGSSADHCEVIHIHSDEEDTLKISDSRPKDPQSSCCTKLDKQEESKHSSLKLQQELHSITEASLKTSQPEAINSKPSANSSIESNIDAKISDNTRKDQKSSFLVYMNKGKPVSTILLDPETKQPIMTIGSTKKAKNMKEDKQKQSHKRSLKIIDLFDEEDPEQNVQYVNNNIPKKIFESTKSSNDIFRARRKSLSEAESLRRSQSQEEFLGNSDKKVQRNSDIAGNDDGTNCKKIISRRKTIADTESNEDIARKSRSKSRDKEVANCTKARRNRIVSDSDNREVEAPITLTTPKVDDESSTDTVMLSIKAKEVPPPVMKVASYAFLANYKIPKKSASNSNEKQKNIQEDTPSKPTDIKDNKQPASRKKEESCSSRKDSKPTTPISEKKSFSNGLDLKNSSVDNTTTKKSTPVSVTSNESLSTSVNSSSSSDSKKVTPKKITDKTTSTPKRRKSSSDSKSSSGSSRRKSICDPEETCESSTRESSQDAEDTISSIFDSPTEHLESSEDSDVTLAAIKQRIFGSTATGGSKKRATSVEDDVEEQMEALFHCSTPKRGRDDDEEEISSKRSTKIVSSCVMPACQEIDVARTKRSLSMSNDSSTTKRRKSQEKPSTSKQSSYINYADLIKMKSSAVVEKPIDFISPLSSRTNSYSKPCYSDKDKKSKDTYDSVIVIQESDLSPHKLLVRRKSQQEVEEFQKRIISRRHSFHFEPIEPKEEPVDSSDETFEDTQEEVEPQRIVARRSSIHEITTELKPPEDEVFHPRPIRHDGPIKSILKTSSTNHNVDVNYNNLPVSISLDNIDIDKVFPSPSNDDDEMALDVTSNEDLTNKEEENLSEDSAIYVDNIDKELNERIAVDMAKNKPKFTTVSKKTVPKENVLTSETKSENNLMLTTEQAVNITKNLFVSLLYIFEQYYKMTESVESQKVLGLIPDMTEKKKYFTLRRNLDLKKIHNTLISVKVEHFSLILYFDKLTKLLLEQFSKYQEITEVVVIYFLQRVIWILLENFTSPSDEKYLFNHVTSCQSVEYLVAAFELKSTGAKQLNVKMKECFRDFSGKIVSDSSSNNESSNQNMEVVHEPAVNVVESTTVEESPRAERNENMNTILANINKTKTYLASTQEDAASNLQQGPVGPPQVRRKSLTTYELVYDSSSSSSSDKTDKNEMNTIFENINRNKTYLSNTKEDTTSNLQQGPVGPPQVRRKSVTNYEHIYVSSSSNSSDKTTEESVPQTSTVEKDNSTVPVAIPTEVLQQPVRQLPDTAPEKTPQIVSNIELTSEILQLLIGNKPVKVPLPVSKPVSKPVTKPVPEVANPRMINFEGKIANQNKKPAKNTTQKTSGTVFPPVVMPPVTKEPVMIPSVISPPVVQNNHLNQIMQSMPQYLPQKSVNPAINMFPHNQNNQVNRAIVPKGIIQNNVPVYQTQPKMIPVIQNIPFIPQQNNQLPVSIVQPVPQNPAVLNLSVNQSRQNGKNKFKAMTSNEKPTQNSYTYQNPTVYQLQNLQVPQAPQVPQVPQVHQVSQAPPVSQQQTFISYPYHQRAPSNINEYNYMVYQENLRRQAVAQQNYERYMQEIQAAQRHLPSYQEHLQHNGSNVRKPPPSQNELAQQRLNHLINCTQCLPRNLQNNPHHSNNQPNQRTDVVQIPKKQSSQVQQNHKEYTSLLHTNKSNMIVNPTMRNPDNPNPVPKVQQKRPEVLPTVNTSNFIINPTTKNPVLPSMPDMDRLQRQLVNFGQVAPLPGSLARIPQHSSYDMDSVRVAEPSKEQPRSQTGSQEMSISIRSPQHTIKWRMKKSLTGNQEEADSTSNQSSRDVEGVIQFQPEGNNSLRNYSRDSGYFSPVDNVPQVPEKRGIICEKCSAPSNLMCSGCHSYFYCSPTCQQLDWSDHELKCVPPQRTK